MIVLKINYYCSYFVTKTSIRNIIFYLYIFNVFWLVHFLILWKLKLGLVKVCELSTNLNNYEMYFAKTASIRCNNSDILTQRRILVVRSITQWLTNWKLAICICYSRTEYVTTIDRFKALGARARFFVHYEPNQLKQNGR